MEFIPLHAEPEPPPSPVEHLPQGTAHRFEDGALRITLSLDAYGFPAIFRSCYRFTDRCYIYLAPPKDGVLEVTLIAKSGRANSTDQLAAEFLNDLIDQRLRVEINAETLAIRELIVAQAFAAVDLIDDQGRPLSRSELPAEPGDSDPQGIHQWRPAS